MGSNSSNTWTPGQLKASSSRWILGLVMSLGLGLGLGSSCERPCTSSSNCVRTASCVNSNTDQRSDCAVAFRCEGADQVCEPAEKEFSDDDICEIYAANALCGVERCLSDADCVKVISCPLFAGGQPTGQFQDCTIGFRCDPTSDACEVRSTADDADLCANECSGF